MNKKELQQLKDEIREELMKEVKTVFKTQIEDYYGSCIEVYEKPDYVTVDEAAKRLDVKINTAYKVLQKLNNQLKEKGYITKAGAVPRAYFDERCYFKPLKKSLVTNQSASDL